MEEVTAEARYTTKVLFILEVEELNSGNSTLTSTAMMIR